MQGTFYFERLVVLMIVSQERQIQQNRDPVSVDAAILSLEGIECRIPFDCIPVFSMKNQSVCPAQILGFGKVQFTIKAIDFANFNRQDSFA